MGTCFLLAVADWSRAQSRHHATRRCRSPYISCYTLSRLTEQVQKKTSHVFSESHRGKMAEVPASSKENVRKNTHFFFRWTQGGNITHPHASCSSSNPSMSRVVLRCNVIHPYRCRGSGVQRVKKESGIIYRGARTNVLQTPCSLLTHSLVRLTLRTRCTAVTFMFLLARSWATVSLEPL